MKVMKVLLCYCVVLLLAHTSQAQVPLRTHFYFAHIADGRIDEDDEFRTIMVLNNPNAINPAIVTLTIYGQDGIAVGPGIMKFRCLQALGPCLSIGEIIEPVKLLNFTIPASGLFQVMTSRVDAASLFVGYAEATSNVGISGTAVFADFESHSNGNELEVEIESQAAVVATYTMTKFAVANFRKNELEGELPGGVEFEYESDSSTGLAAIYHVMFRKNASGQLGRAVSWSAIAASDGAVGPAYHFLISALYGSRNVSSLLGGGAS